jgi:hypothetical protein
MQQAARGWFQGIWSKRTGPSIGIALTLKTKARSQQLTRGAIKTNRPNLTYPSIKIFQTLNSKVGMDEKNRGEIVTEYSTKGKNILGWKVAGHF